VTRLRKMMLEELQRRNYSAITMRKYLRVVTEFAKYFGKSPDRLGPNELRTYQAYLLKERKLTPGSVINQVAALREADGPCDIRRCRNPARIRCARGWLHPGAPRHARRSYGRLEI
jgi:Phage integrase, N-terminal SAM-like domain